MARILVVENERVVARDLARLLAELGHVVSDIASTYDAALESLRASGADLVLLDVNLDGERDGVALAIAIRESFDVPIAFITAHADPRTLTRAAIARPNGYLVKPFHLDQIDAIVRVAIANFEPMRTSVDWGRLAAGRGRGARLAPESAARVDAMMQGDALETCRSGALARAAGVNGRALSNQFAGSFGATPRRVLIQRRIEESKRLLRDTDQSIAVIALAVGFADQPHFTKTFRKVVGATPAAYRRALIGKLFD